MAPSLQGKWEEAREHREGALGGSTGREHREGAPGGSPRAATAAAAGRFPETPSVMKREEEAETHCARDHLSTS